MRHARQMVSALIPPVLIFGAVWFGIRDTGPEHASKALPQEATASWYNGVALAELRDLGPFERTTGEHPQIVQLYLGLTKPLEIGAARAVIRQGAMPLFEINPRRISLTAIADGTYDRALRADARAIRALGRPVAIGFAHEANGGWFTWGCGHQAPAAYIAAWRHVHKVLGTRDVKYIWVVNHSWNGAKCSLGSRYPGAAYVNWIGVDGYLRSPSDTFSGVFGHTISDLRRFRKPILITEAGVPAGPGQAQRITSLYAGARSAHMIGVVYFDSGTRKGDYRPQDNPAALAAFRKAIGAK